MAVSNGRLANGFTRLGALPTPGVNGSEPPLSGNGQAELMLTLGFELILVLAVRVVSG